MIQNKYLHTPLDKARIHMLDEYVDLAKSSSKDLMRLIPYKDSSQYGTKARSKDQNLTKSEGSLDPKLLKLSGRISSTHSGEVWKGSYRDVDIVVKLLKMRQCSERHVRNFILSLFSFCHLGKAVLCSNLKYLFSSLFTQVKNTFNQCSVNNSAILVL